MKKKKILISGTASGLGKFLNKKIYSVRFNRKKNLKYYENTNWDCIIHCGAYAGDSVEKIFESIYTTYKISKLKSKKFIFISSMITENKNISLYKISKLICENILKERKQLVILKLGSIIGKYMRKNTISKLIKDKDVKIGLSKKSLYSFISFSEILDFINICLKRNYIGTFNFLRNDFITLEKISKKLNKKVRFGNFFFKGINGSNSKINKIYNLREKTSIDVIIDEIKKI